MLVDRLQLMREEVQRLAESELAVPSCLVFKAPALEKVRAVLAANVGRNLTEIVRPGLNEAGEFTGWREYRDEDTGETVDVLNEGTSCPPLPMSECQMPAA